MLSMLSMCYRYVLSVKYVKTTYQVSTGYLEHIERIFWTLVKNQMIFLSRHTARQSKGERAYRCKRDWDHCRDISKRTHRHTVKFERANRCNRDWSRCTAKPFPQLDAAVLIFCKFTCAHVDIAAEGCVDIGVKTPIPIQTGHTA
jgi:hypothetical protein